MTEQSDTVEHWWSKTAEATVVVFDLDGTLINSDLANFMSYDAALSQVLPFQSRLPFDPRARTTRETIKKCFPDICDGKITEIVSLKESLYYHFLSKTSLNVQVANILERSSGKKLILATNSHRYRADQLLIHHRIADKFTNKLYRDVTDSRDKYKRLMAGIRDEKKSIVVFENDVYAIQSAIASGIQSDCIIDVTNSW